MKKAMPLEEQIRLLDTCGIRLCPGITIEDFLCSFPRELFEAEPFEHTIVKMGSDSERDDAGRISEDIWHFDTECIYDNGDYVAIAERLRNLAKGELPIRNIKDMVSYDDQTAWLEFEMDDVKKHVDLEFSDDWVDTSVFQHFIDILQSRKSTRQFTYLDLGGQDCMIGCCTLDEFAKLIDVTGLDFKWQGKPPRKS